MLTRGQKSLKLKLKSKKKIQKQKNNQNRLNGKSDNKETIKSKEDTFRKDIVNYHPNGKVRHEAKIMYEIDKRGIFVNSEGKAIVHKVIENAKKERDTKGYIENLGKERLDVMVEVNKLGLQLWDAVDVIRYFDDLWNIIF